MVEVTQPLTEQVLESLTGIKGEEVQYRILSWGKPSLQGIKVEGD